jgi:excisionase family DNA binding protein
VRFTDADSMSESLKDFEMRNVIDRRLPDALMRVEAVADYMGVSVRTVWRLVSSGRLARPVAIGRCKRWRRADVEKFVAALHA